MTFTVGSFTPRAQYTAGAAQQDFSIPFEFLANSDLTVRVNGAVPVISQTITGAGVSGGGNCHFNSPLTGGEIVTIYGTMQIARTADRYSAFGLLPAATLEDDTDRLVLMMKQIARDVRGTLHSDPIDTTFEMNSLPTASLRNGKFLSFDATGQPILSSGTGNDTAFRTDVASTAVGADGSLLAGFRRSETGSVAMSVHAVLNGWLFVTMFGAVGDDATDNATALSNALLATDASNGGDVFVPRGVYRVNSTITSSRTKIHLHGEKGSEIKFVGSLIPGIDFLGDHVTVDGIKFTSTLGGGTTPPVGIRATDASYFEVTNCTFNRLCLNDRCSQSTAERWFTCKNNTFQGDWTGWAGSDSTNVIDVRGVQNIEISGNRFENVGLEKLIKVSCSLSQTNLPIGAWRSKRLKVIGNSIDITSTNGITVIDFFASTEEVVIANNNINVQGTFAHIIHCKPGDLATTQSPYQKNIVVADNTIVGAVGVTDCVLLNGAWGTAWFSVRQTCNITGNTIQHDIGGSNATVNVKGMNFANISDNTFDNASGNFRHAILAYNNQITKVCDNYSAFGNFDFAGNGSTPDGLAYTNQPESITVSGNTIDDFDSQGAISFFNCTAIEELIIADNAIRNQTDTGSVVGCIHFSTVTITDLNIHDNASNLANAAKNIVSGAPTVTRYRMHDNSWNTISFTYDPGNLVDGAGETSGAQTLTGAAFGGVVDIAAPYDLQGITVTAYVSAANTIKVRVQNESTATVDLASGTWRASYRRLG